MTGQEIANNLKRSRRKWGKGAFFDPAAGQYCVLGIKAVEAGVTTKTLLNEPELSDFPQFGAFGNLGDLVKLNDDCTCKRELIDELEAMHRKTRFPVKAWIRAMLRFQRENWAQLAE